ncbi:MAG: NAD(+) diphosphatase [Anaerolineae bacterium]|nr:NAD(+) diphosphatase [Anaerolineae bacterium]
MTESRPGDRPPDMDPYLRAQRNAFVTHTVDRAHSRRQDETWLAQTFEHPQTRFVVVWQDQILLEETVPQHLSRLSPSDVTTLQGRCPDAQTDIVLLGQLGGVTYFAVGMGDACQLAQEDTRSLGQFLDLRGAASLLDAEEGALAAQAKAMIHWHRQHRFCGQCGSPTNLEEGGYVRRCTNPACAQVHFPRVDPAIIVLVTSGDRCLLGRQGRWPQGRYSNIAGFVEPGESLETAVAREVAEETGIEIRAVTYHSSQPWPFPQSLMVGFTAEAASTEIHLNDGELEDARWFTREAIREGLISGDLGLPSPYSISFHLIEDWFDTGSLGELKALTAKLRAE